MTPGMWLAAYLLVTVPCIVLCIRDAVRWVRRQLNAHGKGGAR